MDEKTETTLDQVLTQMGISQNSSKTESSVPPSADETPEVQAPSPDSPQEPSVPETAQPVPEKQESRDTTDWKKIAKDNQAAYTRSQQELAELKKRLASFTPAEIAVMQTAQGSNAETEGQAAMRKLIENSPEMFEDPQKQVRLMENIAANTPPNVAMTLQMIRDYDNMKAYAAEAKEVLGPEFDPSMYEADAWEAYNIHRRLNKAGNPFLTAVSVVNQNILKQRMATSQLGNMQDDSRVIEQRSNIRMEKPGNPVTSEPEIRGKLSDLDFCKNFVTSDPKKFPSFSRR